MLMEDLLLSVLAFRNWRVFNISSMGVINYDRIKIRNHTKIENSPPSKRPKKGDYVSQIKYAYQAN